MAPSRVSLALDSGLIAPFAGAVCVLNAPADLDDAPFAGAALTTTQRLKPAHDALAARAIACAPEIDGEFDTVIVQCHRAKGASHALIAEAMRLVKPGGRVLVEGDKTQGIDSIAKDLRRTGAQLDSYAKAHGKLLWFNATPGLSLPESWSQTRLTPMEGWQSTVGSFSAEKPDKGSELLARHLPALKGAVADLGAGWGYLAPAILASDAVTELVGFEADFHAVEDAKFNVTDPRAHFEWVDATALDGRKFDAVVTNPPFHAGRAAEPALGIAFLQAAARILRPKGQLWLVANRGLPYEKTLDDLFRQVVPVAEENGFKLIRAAQPKNARPAR